MAVAFTTAPTVAVDAVPTSAMYRAQRMAMNDRLRSGLAETWRIIFYFYGFWRNLRNPVIFEDVITSQPPDAEALEVYANLDPADASFPIAAPGTDEGINVVNPIGAFVFGAAALDLDSEDARLADIPVPAAGSPSSFWHIRKLQSGGYDPVTHNLGAPALEIAVKHSYIRYRTTGVFGNSYGGYVPSPKLATQPYCDPADEENSPLDYELKFTALKAGLPDYVWSSCDTSVYYGTTFYYIIHAGTPIILLKKNYLEGPYSDAGMLHKMSGDQLQRILINSFIRDFRGSEDQLASDLEKSSVKCRWKEMPHAFDFQKFFTQQYLLAPNRAATTGDVLTPLYPKVVFSDNAPSGTVGTFEAGGASHSYTTGFVLTGALVTASGLVAGTVIEIRDGSTLLKRVSVGDNHDQVIQFPDAPTPASLSVVLTSDLIMAAGGNVSVEFTELLAYKPEISDAYLLLRLAGANHPDAPLEGSGTKFSSSKQIGNTYFNYGVIAGPGSGVTDSYGSPISGGNPAINGNPGYDAARRNSRCIRIIPRHQLKGYAIDEEGRSVCYFNRYALGLDTNTPLDSFEGIAPSRVATLGTVKPGYVYIVRAGEIKYGPAGSETTYTAGDKFTAVYGQGNFDSISDPIARVYEYEGIRNVAPPRGFTNEWLFEPQFKAAKDNYTSPFKPDGLNGSDILALSERCVFGADFYEVSRLVNRDLNLQFNYGAQAGTTSVSFHPELPTSYRYANGINFYYANGDPRYFSDPDKLVAFYKSCRIYEPNAEIISCTVETMGDADGDGTNEVDEVVKCVFKKRFHHHPNAPGVILRDRATWDLDALRDEQTPGTGGWRSNENGIRAYLVAQDGSPCPGQVIGDFAARNGIAMQNNYHLDGTCYPHFLWTQLIPLPHEDGNATTEDTDSVILNEHEAQLELYIRATCEGFVDAKTTSEINCGLDETGAPRNPYGSRRPGCIYDFTYPNLCLQANDNRWLPLFPTTVRTDNLEGFGGAPNILIYAQSFNEKSRCLNLMTKVRISLPSKLEIQTCSFADTLPSSTELVPILSGCAAHGRNGVWNATTPSAACSAWSESPSFQAQSRQTYDQPSGNIVSERDVVSYRFQFVDGGAINAIPEEWRDMIENFQGVGFFANKQDLTEFPVFSEGPFEGRFMCGSVGDGGCDGGGYMHINDGGRLILSCSEFNNGTIDPGPPPSGWVYDTGLNNPQNGNQRCTGGTRHLIAIEPLRCHSTFFEVPMV